MRELTEVEAKVMATLLAGGLLTERERVRRAGVARSSFLVARRRLYEQGWVADHYVPQPGPLGIERVTFALARPFAEGAQTLAAAWHEDPGNVLLWKGANTVLGVFFHRAASASQGLTAEGEAGPLASRITRVSADPRTPLAPVYFDYEGIWDHLLGSTGVQGYPRSLGAFQAAGGRELRLPGRDRAALQDLLRRKEQVEQGDRAGHRLGPSGLPRSQYRLVASGRVQHRVVPRWAQLPPYEGFSLHRMVLLQGSLLPGRRPDEVFRALVADCQVLPFLFATDGLQVLVGALGGREVLPERLRDRLGARAPVLETLKGYLRGIDVALEDIAHVAVLRDHDYARPEVLGPD